MAQHKWDAKHQYYVDGKGKKRKVEPVKHECLLCGESVVGTPPEEGDCSAAY